MLVCLIRKCYVFVEYPPLVIYTDEKMSVGYILNVSNQDRPNSIPSGLYHFACPSQPQNSDNNDSSKTDWLEVKSFIKVTSDNATTKEQLLREENQWKCDKPVTPTFDVLSETVTDNTSHKIAAIGFKVRGRMELFATFFFQYVHWE